MYKKVILKQPENQNKNNNHWKPLNESIQDYENTKFYNKIDNKQNTFNCDFFQPLYNDLKTDWQHLGYFSLDYYNIFLKNLLKNIDIVPKEIVEEDTNSNDDNMIFENDDYE